MVKTAEQTVGERAEQAMYAFVDAYDRDYGAAATAFDLTVPQVCVLVRLRQPRTMGSLAVELECDASNITQIVNRLEARGLVSREEDPIDRRSRLLRLTREGLRIVRGFERAFTFARDAVDRLSPRETEELARLLRKARGPG